MKRLLLTLLILQAGIALASEREIILRVYIETSTDSYPFYAQSPTPINVDVFCPPESEDAREHNLAADGRLSIPSASSRVRVCVEGFRCREALLGHEDPRSEFAVGLVLGRLAGYVGTSADYLTVEVNPLVKTGRLRVHLMPLYDFGMSLHSEPVDQEGRAVFREVPFGTYVAVLSVTCMEDGFPKDSCNGFPLVLQTQVLNIHSDDTIQLRSE